MKRLVSVVVPLYNEQEVILESCKRLKAVMDGSGYPYEIILVNDGSRDDTLPLAKGVCSGDGRFKLLSFSRNFGHQCAITAGMDNASGEAVVVIDADLQDPPELIPQMLERWEEGYGVVYGLRSKREGETAMKKLTATVFYRLLGSMSEVEIPNDAGDFRLLDRAVVDVLKSMPEHNRYVRGLVSWIGFRQTAVEYVRKERFAGTTKYSLKKMLRLADDGVTSFSKVPLRLPLFLGAAVCFLSAIAFIVTLCCGAGLWIMLPIILFFIGLMTLCIGFSASYLGRVYDEALGRPKYIIEEKVNF